MIAVTFLTWNLISLKEESSPSAYLHCSSRITVGHICTRSDMYKMHSYLPKINLDKLVFIFFRCAPTSSAVQPRPVSWVARQAAWCCDVVVRDRSTICHAQGKQAIWFLVKEIFSYTIYKKPVPTWSVKCVQSSHIYQCCSAANSWIWITQLFDVSITQLVD